MKEFYTLQECFEACGSKFPFTVSYHINYNDIIILKFISVKENGNWHHDQYHKYKFGSIKINNECYNDHIGFANQRSYSYIEHLYKQFKKDVNNLINEK